MEDIILTCLCGEQFVFTKGEQEFYAARGYQQPKRCLKCRRLKKQNNPQQQVFGKPASTPEQFINRDYKRDRRERHNYDDRDY